MKGTSSHSIKNQDKKRLQSWTIVFDLLRIIEDGLQHDIKYKDVHTHIHIMYMIDVTQACTTKRK